MNTNRTKLRTRAVAIAAGTLICRTSNRGRRGQPSALERSMPRSRHRAVLRRRPPTAAIGLRRIRGDRSPRARRPHDGVDRW